MQSKRKVFLSDPADPILKMHDCGSDTYWFYHKNSYPIDVPAKYVELLNSATLSITVWDSYFNLLPSGGDYQMFQQINEDITIKILTLKSLTGANANYLSNIFNSFRLTIPGSRRTRIAIRAIDKNNFHLINWQFHDRFLIIDDHEVYSIGSSIRYHRESHLSTGILKIHDSDTASFIQTIFDSYWQQAIANEIPIQFLHP